jgi:hypothetical protein
MLALTGAGGDGAAPAPAEPLPGTDQSIRTSFGTMIVGRVLTVNGLTAKATSGVTHGIQNAVWSEDAQVETTVYLSNARSTTLEYAPTDFSVQATRPKGRKRVLPVIKSDVGPGTLQPMATVELRLSFKVPRDGSRMLLAYRDPGSKSPIYIRLGRINAGAKDPGDGHHHSH